MSTQPRYLVSVCGPIAPTRIHTNWHEAKLEAERLSKQTSNRDHTIHIVEIKATLKPAASHVWEVEQ